MTFPLSELLLRSADGHARVAFGADGEATQADLVADALALAAELPGPSGARWLVESEDGYRVAVAMVAAGVAGARISLPPNLQPGTLAELAGGCACVLTEEARSQATSGARVLDPLAPRRSGRTPAAATAIDRDAPLVELFTSGTSGPGRSVLKSLRHLEDEVVTLERELAGRVAGAGAVFASASPRHLYGLLFRVLWPLAYGRPFLRTSLLLPDELLQNIVAESRPAVVVSTPAHLRHLVACPRLAGAGSRIAAVFSSGGPLDPATALALEETLGHAPVEIFGSTETGGVAYRQTTAAQPSPTWRTMEPVRIDADTDSRLVVTSPFVTSPEDGRDRFVMGDHVELDGGGFRLKGRADRVAKIGEKTFSLPAIEQTFLDHAFVDAVCVAAYDDKTGARLGALVVLSKAARVRAAEQGRRAVQNELGDHLARTWDRVAVPRRWRFVDALPHDERGKLPAAAIDAVLQAPAPPVLLPLVLDEQRSDGGIRRSMVVPRDLACLEGHYEGHPLVQGVAQLDWAMRALDDLLGTPARPQRMEAVKFKDVLRPAQAFTLHVEFDAAARRATFTLADGARTFSSGRIVLEPAS